MTGERSDYSDYLCTLNHGASPEELHIGDRVCVLVGSYANLKATIKDITPEGYTIVADTGMVLWHYRREQLALEHKGVSLKEYYYLLDHGKVE